MQPKKEDLEVQAKDVAPKENNSLPQDLGQKLDTKGKAFQFDFAENHCKPGSGCCG